MTRTIDFDAFRAERASDPVELKIGGKTYQLPASMPATVAIDIIRLKGTMEDGADVPVELLDTMGSSIFGDALWRTILVEHRIEVDELGDLIQLVLKTYSPEKPEDPQPAST